MTAVDTQYRRLGDLIARYGLGRDKVMGYRAELQHALTQRETRELIARVKRDGGPSVPWSEDDLQGRRVEGGLQLRRLRAGEISLDDLLGVAPLRQPEPVEIDDDGAAGEWAPPESATAPPEEAYTIGEGARQVTVRKDKRYIFDRASRTYQTWIACEDQWWEHSADLRDWIAEKYTKFGDGLTQQEVARELGWTESQVHDFLKAHRIRKGSLTISPEDAAAADTQAERERLARSMTSVRMREIKVESDHQVERELRRAAQQWGRVGSIVVATVEEAVRRVGTGEPLERLHLPQSRPGYALVAVYTDVHWGARSWRAESGYDYSREVARRRIDHTCQQLLDWIRAHGAPSEILVPVGSDWWHVDGLQRPAATTRGTPQDVDGTAAEIFETGLQELWRLVRRLGQIAPVRCVPMPGNHDNSSGKAALAFLSAHAQHHDWLTCPRAYLERVAVPVLGTVCGFAHGDKGQGSGVSERRAMDYDRWLAREARKLGMHGARRIAFCGHLHHLKERDAAGLRVVQCTALCDPDAWHAAEGYEGSEVGLTCQVIEESGPTHRLFFGVEGE